MAPLVRSRTVQEAVTPTDLLARVRASRAAAIAAEADLLVAAAEWADAHPVLEGDAEPFPARDRHPADPFVEEAREFDADRGIPAWQWSAGAPFAAALGRSTAAGENLIRDALILRHRLPRVWARVTARDLEAWRGRRIAQLVTGSPDDVCAHLDAILAEVAHKVGPITLDRLLDEAMLRLYPEEREAEQLAALDARYARLHQESINDSGIADMWLRGDWKDLHDFDQALADVAAALAAADEAEGRHADSLDVRRSRAVGVLADPEAALALLNDDPAPAPSKRAVLVFHLSEEAAAGRDPVGRCESLGRAMLDQVIRDWCGRRDTHLTVQPVIDLNDHTHVEAYEASDRLRTRSDLIHLHCVFPWCTKPARRCDHDHRVPHGRGGVTCDCNLAPLCRHHHRLKTHAGWTYTLLETGSSLWSDPHGQQFLVDPTGTLDVTPPDRSVNHATGCRHGTDP